MTRPAARRSAERIRALQAAIEELRRETGTGWIGQQDDVTGYLANLSGGSWPGTPDRVHGRLRPRLFGVDSAVLRLGDPDSQTVPGMTTTRATQAIGEVPVRDATLVFTARADRLTGIAGRVFPGLAVSTTPIISPEQAAATAAQLAGGTSNGAPRLVVLPSGAGVLAWEVVVVVTDRAAPGTP